MNNAEIIGEPVEGSSHSEEVTINHYIWMTPTTDSLWMCDDDGKWRDLTAATNRGHGSTNTKWCHTLRAFRRQLRNLGRYQPELAGVQFTLIGRYVGQANKFGRVPVR